MAYPKDSESTYPIPADGSRGKEFLEDKGVHRGERFILIRRDGRRSHTTLRFHPFVLKARGAASVGGLVAKKGRARRSPR